MSQPQPRIRRSLRVLFVLVLIGKFAEQPIRRAYEEHQRQQRIHEAAALGSEVDPNKRAVPDATITELDR